MLSWDPMAGEATETSGSRPEPGFDHPSTVHFDELDPMKMLHNTRYTVLVERAIIAFYYSTGRVWELDIADNPDQFQAVKQFSIEFMVPFLGIGEMTTTIWVEWLGRASCTYGFRCTSHGGDLLHASGRRTHVKLHPDTLRAAPWTDWFREFHAPLLRQQEAGSRP